MSGLSATSLYFVADCFDHLNDGGRLLREAWWNFGDGLFDDLMYSISWLWSDRCVCGVTVNALMSVGSISVMA